MGPRKSAAKSGSKTQDFGWQQQRHRQPWKNWRCKMPQESGYWFKFNWNGSFHLQCSLLSLHKHQSNWRAMSFARGFFKICKALNTQQTVSCVRLTQLHQLFIHAFRFIRVAFFPFANNSLGLCQRMLVWAKFCYGKLKKTDQYEFRKP